MSMSISVEEYIARQPSYTWRRNILRGAIRGIVLGALLRMTITGRENIPDDGPAILMINHTSLLDPVLCMGAVLNRFVIPMSKVELMHHPVIGPLINFWGAYAVNRGQIDRKALTNSIELIKSGQMILMSPEGTRQRNGLAQPKDGLAYIATKADALIVPAAVSGTANWESKLARLHRPQIDMNFGRPFRFRTEGRTRIPREELAAMSEEAMYQLSLAITDESLRGIYRDVENATTNHISFV